jgi:CTP synthase (UTP-ammonia lyase)
MAEQLKAPGVSDPLFGPSKSVPKALEKEAAEKSRVESKIEMHRTKKEKLERIRKNLEDQSDNVETAIKYGRADQELKAYESMMESLKKAGVLRPSEFDAFAELIKNQESVTAKTSKYRTILMYGTGVAAGGNLMYGIGRALFH